METSINRAVKFLIMFLPAFLVCFLISFIYNEPQVSAFDIRSGVLQFMIAGALGALFFALLETLSIRIALIVFIVLSLFSQPYISLQTDFPLYIRMILFHTALGVSIYIYWRYPSADKKVIWNRPLQLAGYLGLTYFIIAGLWHLLYIGYLNVFIGFLSRGFILGLGLGIGIEFGNYILNRTSKTSGEHPAIDGEQLSM